MTEHSYIFNDAKDRSEYERLRSIEELFDPRTRKRLESLGSLAAKSVLEVGAGAGGLLPWMLEKTGSRGGVTGVDLDTRFLDRLQHRNLKVLKGDWAKMELEAGAYDLIHERYVLMHNPGFREMLDRMMASLRPGGWLLAEDADFSAARWEGPEGPGLKSFDALREAVRRLFEQKHNDYAFGSKLGGYLAQAGFADVREDVFAPLESGGQGTAEVMRQSTLQLWNQYLQTGAVTEADLRTYVEMAGNPGVKAVFYSTVSVWAQKPL